MTSTEQSPQPEPSFEELLELVRGKALDELLNMHWAWAKRDKQAEGSLAMRSEAVLKNLVARDAREKWQKGGTDTPAIDIFEVLGLVDKDSTARAEPGTGGGDTPAADRGDREPTGG